VKRKPTTFALGVGIVLVSLLIAETLLAQNIGPTLSGTITNASGEIVSGAKVSVKNEASGQSTETQTNSVGFYTVPNLRAGEYEVSVAAEGFAAKLANVALTGEVQQTLNLVLSVESAQPQTPANNSTAAPSENLPNAPSSTATQPSLQDLGFTPEQSQGNTKEQALLDKRTHMLKIHQRMGLITTIPLLATLITSVNAGGKSTSATSRDLHTALGAVTGDLYFITAYYAIRAPRLAGTETRGPIRMHKALAWIHGPGMILTPILGIMAYDQKSKGEKVHGIASAHAPVAIVTAGAFGAALLSVSLKF
jgi:Carboxypeptidase regulatory-like domain